MSDDKTVQAILHYQKNLERYINRKDELKMMHCMERLQQLPITVSHLEQTGVGRTVNSVRKMRGIHSEPKNSAKNLVSKWKQMVTEEELNESDDDEEDDDDDDSEADHDDSDDRLQIYDEDDVQQAGVETRNIEVRHSSHRDNSHDEDDDDEEEESHRKYRDRDNYSVAYTDSKYCDSGYRSTETMDMETRETRVVKHASNNSSFSEEFAHFDDEPMEANQEPASSSASAASSPANNDVEERMKDVESYRSFEDVPQVSEAKSERKDREKRHEKSHSSSKTTPERSEKHESTKEKEREKSRSKESHKERRDKDREREKENHENGYRKRSSSSDRHKSDRSSKHKSSSSGSSSSSRRENKEHHSSSNSSSKKDKEKSSRDVEKSSKEESKKSSSSSHRSSSTSASTSSSTNYHKSTSSSSTTEPTKDKDKEKDRKRRHESSTSSSSSKPSSSKKPKIDVSRDEGISYESGASFAEALGMIPTTPASTSVKHSTSTRKDKREHKDKDAKEHNSTPSTSRSEKAHKDHARDREKHAKSAHKEKHRKSEEEKDRSKEKEHEESSQRAKSSKVVHALAVLRTAPTTNPKLEDINISSLLPQISTNYKPLAYQPPESRPDRRPANDAEALTRLMYTKTARTKVYSGNRTFLGKVPTLFDVCIRVLQDNLDSLEYTGGVPYSILKPVIERANPDQLFTLEHYNPYIMEDSDELWQLHCQKEFKTKQRNEMETWREMYLRCVDEREAKLKSLTANIKLSQDKCLPVRQTKLAYVDTMVKPPPNIAKKQAKNGILEFKKPAMTPTHRLSQLALAGGADKVSVPNPGAHRVNSGGGGGYSGGNSGGGGSYNVKPKKAPLMAKTLQLMKGRFRR